MSDDGAYFISYSREDTIYTKRLAAFLESVGVRVWRDDEIPAGQRWHDVLLQQIEASSGVLLVMTPAAGASRWVAEEVRDAQAHGKPVIPLLLNGDVILGLGDIHFENVSDAAMPSDAFVERLRGGQPRRQVVGVMLGGVPELAEFYVERASTGVEEGLGQSRIFTGLGGVGKTQIAAAYARRLRDRGDLDLMMWVNAASRDAIVSAFATAAARVLGLDADDPSAPRQFLAHLANTRKRWLVVLDDLLDPRDLDTWWPPRSTTGTLLVTTRRTDASLNSHGIVTPVGLFTMEQARTYVGRKLASDPSALDEVDELCADLGLLPLALAQAAAYMATESIGCAEYRRLFAEQHEGLDPELFPDDYTRPVSVSLALSIVVARRTAPVGLAEPLLAVLSLLEPSGIPRTLVDSVAVIAHVAATREPPGRDTVDERSVSAALACLHRLSLVVAPPSGGATVSIHALVQRAARGHLSLDLLRGAAKAAADGLYAVWPEVERDGTGPLMRANATALRRAAEDDLWQPDPHVLLARIGGSLGEAGKLAAAIAHFEELAEECSRRTGRDTEWTLVARHNAAVWRLINGDAIGAEAAARRNLAEALAVLPKGHTLIQGLREHAAASREAVGDAAGAVAELQTLFDERMAATGGVYTEDTSRVGTLLASALGSVGRHVDAAAILDRVVAATAAALGPDHRDTLTMMNNLAVARAEMGDTAGALQANRDVLERRLRVLGPDHPDTLYARLNVAAGVRDTGQAGQARELMRELLADVERLLGPAHPLGLAVRASLADLRGDLGDVAGAIADVTAIWQERERTQGARDVATMRERSKVASWYRTAGDYERAAAMLTELLADRLEVMGPDHPDTLRTRRDLISLRGRTSDPVGAIADAQALLADYERVFGPRHSRTREVRAMIASLQRRARRFGDAAATAEALLADTAAVVGPDDPHTLDARAGLIEAIGQAGDPQSALEAVTDLLADRRRVLGPDNPTTLDSWSRYAYWLGMSGDPRGAAAELRQLCVTRIRVHGPDDPRTLRTRYDIADWLGRAGDAAGALALLEQLVQDQARVLGPTHESTSDTLWAVAAKRGETGDVTGAISGTRAILAAREHRYAPDHPAIASARMSLAGWLAQSGDIQSALTIGEAVLIHRLERYGPTHRDTLAARQSLAVWHQKIGDYSAAVKAFDEIVAARLHMTGPRDPATMDVRAQAAAARLYVGEAAAALAALEEVLADRLAVFGPDHPDTIETQAAIGVARAATGPGSASSELTAAAQARERISGADDPNVLQLRFGAAVYAILHGEANGLADMEFVTADLTRVHGHDHPTTLEARFMLAHGHSEAGDPGGRAELEAVLADQRRVLDPRSAAIMTTRISLAIATHREGELPAAIEAGNQIVADLRDRVGGDPSTVLDMLLLVSQWTAQTGDTDGARTMLTEVLDRRTELYGPDDPRTLDVQQEITQLRSSGR